MSPETAIIAAHSQQQLTGRQGCEVAFCIRGKWPSGGRKRLFGKQGPLGNCIAEYEDSVMCVFKADEVISYCSQFLPKLTIKAKE